MSALDGRHRAHQAAMLITVSVYSLRTWKTGLAIHCCIMLRGSGLPAADRASAVTFYTHRAYVFPFPPPGRETIHARSGYRGLCYSLVSGHNAAPHRQNKDHRTPLQVARLAGKGCWVVQAAARS